MSTPETLELVEQTPLEQLGIQRPRDVIETALNAWGEKDSLGIITDEAALLSCRGVAGQLINPEHVEFANKIEVVYPESERFIKQTDYSLSVTIGHTGEHSAEITAGWDDKALIVAPALGIKNGHPEEFAFMLPGHGIIYDVQEEERINRIIQEQADSIPPHIAGISDYDVLRTLRHVSLVIGDNRRMS